LENPLNPKIEVKDGRKELISYSSGLTAWGANQLGL